MKLASYSPGIVAFNSSVPSLPSLESKPRQPSRRYLHRLLGAEIGNVTHFHGVGTPLLQQSHNYLLHGSPWELTFQCDLCVSLVDVRSPNTEPLRLLTGYYAHRMLVISILELRIKYVMFPEVLQKPFGSVSRETHHTAPGQAHRPCLAIDVARIDTRSYHRTPQSEGCAYTRMPGILVAHDKPLAPTIRN